MLAVQPHSHFKQLTLHAWSDRQSEKVGGSAFASSRPLRLNKWSWLISLRSTLISSEGESNLGGIAFGAQLDRQGRCAQNTISHNQQA
jgi:hypothetical protein